jgi:hypothetical protein
MAYWTTRSALLDGAIDRFTRLFQRALIAGRQKKHDAGRSQDLPWLPGHSHRITSCVSGKRVGQSRSCSASPKPHDQGDEEDDQEHHEEHLRNT